VGYPGAAARRTLAPRSIRLRPMTLPCQRLKGPALYGGAAHHAAACGPWSNHACRHPLRDRVEQLMDELEAATVGTIERGEPRALCLRGLCGESTLARHARRTIMSRSAARPGKLSVTGQGQKISWNSAPRTAARPWRLGVESVSCPASGSDFDDEGARSQAVPRAHIRQARVLR